MALGRINPQTTRTSRSTWPISPIRGSGAVNGVSRLHGEVSRRIFPAAVSALARRGGAGGIRHQWRPRPTWDSASRPTRCGQGLRQGALARHAGDLASSDSGQVPTTSCGSCERQPRRDWSSSRASASRAAGRHRRRSPEEIAQRVKDLRSPTTSDARFRAPVCRRTSGPTCCCTIPSG